MAEEIWRRAVAHVSGLADGPPLPPDLRVTLHFHPDRPVGGVPILRSLGRDGRYRSQFETGVGNGGLTAYPGGDRWRWESRLFGAVYDAHEPAHRPVYGSLNRRRWSTGGSPRFGSSHLRLSADTLARTTFCFPDSYLQPTDFGTAERMGLIPLAEASAARPGADPLDDYVEAHVHGPVLLERDVEALVLDPSFRGTAVEERAARLPCPIEWHPGFRAPLSEIRRHADYRHPSAVAAAERIAAGRKWLTPRMLGEADEEPQLMKWVWHCIARFGRP